MKYENLFLNIGKLPYDIFNELIKKKVIIKKEGKYYIDITSGEYASLLKSDDKLKRNVYKPMFIVESSAHHFKSKETRDEFLRSVNKDLYDVEVKGDSVYLELKNGE